jgi:hypothetical protein
MNSCCFEVLMLRSMLFSAAALFLATGCPAPDVASACGDASYWSQRGSEWPTDALYLGDHPLDQTDALDLLELPPQSGSDRLARALVVAELNQPADVVDADMTTLYAAHAWFTDHHQAGDVGADDEALILAAALQEAQTCS